MVEAGRRVAVAQVVVSTRAGQIEKDEHQRQHCQRTGSRPAGTPRGDQSPTGQDEGDEQQDRNRRYAHTQIDRRVLVLRQQQRAEGQRHDNGQQDFGGPAEAVAKPCQRFPRLAVGEGAEQNVQAYTSQRRQSEVSQ